MSYYINSLIRRKPRFGIIIDFDLFEKSSLEPLKMLIQTIQQYGMIKYSQIISRKKLSESDTYKLNQMGFGVIIAPKNTFAITFLLEAYDLVLENKVNYMIFGSNKDELRVLFLESKKDLIESIGLVWDPINSKMLNYFDRIINLNKVDEFTLLDTLEPEYLSDEIVKPEPEELRGQVTHEDEFFEDSVFGPISEELEYQPED